MEEQLTLLSEQLSGELYWDEKMRLLYATDASAYRELPLAVAYPKDKQDLLLLIKFAREHKTSLIPRTAGTSLAGQVVGAGIVVDVSKYFTEILEVNPEESWVRVQPGVIRDELNLFLKPYKLYFGPETSTANRAMIGGMVGNNSCGSNSLIYGSAREHTLEVEALLSDGSEVTFKALSFEEFDRKCNQPDLEGRLYHDIRSMLGNYHNQEQIRENFPKPSIHRRNTGYAVDMLLETDPFTAGKEPFNFCKLICGSEGTLAFITEIKVHANPLPVNPSGLLCVHFNSLEDALKGNLIVLKHHPLVSELMDKYILECTKSNLEQSKNRFFVEGDPEAILIAEYDGEDQEAILSKVKAVEEDLLAHGLGYHFPLVLGDDKKKVWNLRKAGLGLLSNVPGDEKPVAVIEDTAVDVEDLPAYIKDFNEILTKYNLYAVHYAHAATGELHLRPIINLKTEEGNQLFREIALEIAHLVKKYHGSLSGEHGDGRLRGEFIPLMIGDHNYQLLKEIKKTWDPEGIFNPGKIVDTPSMNSSLRYKPGQTNREIKTVFRYKGQTILQHAEQCNGSGDCRKSHLSGGTMCPSYMATKDEKDTTRARANILREMLTNSEKANPFDHEEIKEVMDLCLSCKGCKTECPSSVDVAKMKAEFLQHYYDANGAPFRAHVIANFTKSQQLGSLVAPLYNFFSQNKFTSGLIKQVVGFAPDRSLPEVSAVTLRQWVKKQTPKASNRQVYLFCDEFTDYNDTSIGQTAYKLLTALGYEVLLASHKESGRTYLSKGFVKEAKKLAIANVSMLKDKITAETPLIGIEPSAIITFRDEYLTLVDADLQADAMRIAQNALMIDEFLAQEIDKGFIHPEQFSAEKQHIKLHGHCYQKAFHLVGFTEKVLSLPANYSVEVIPSGCCGMAGSFGYEKEHYDVSMKVAELVLLPAVRTASEEIIIAAAGTSCRHQIKDGAARKSYHPVEILYKALIK